MRKTLIIGQDRYLDIVDENGKSTLWVGVIGENNAEILDIKKPDKINGETIENFICQFVISVDDEIYVIEPYSNQFSVDERFTSAESLILVVQFVKDGEVKWKSHKTTLFLHSSLSDVENHRNYLDSIDFSINARGHLIMDYEGNIDFNRNGDNLEVDI